jgi:hypothetical protein
VALLTANTLYLTPAMRRPYRIGHERERRSFGALPLAIALWLSRDSIARCAGRWSAFTPSLSILPSPAFQHRPGNGGDLAVNGVLFTVYIGCCIHFWIAYRRATAGAFITIAGFLAWASVFLVAPLMAGISSRTYLPWRSEVWNLPKYLVAIGMILLLLEDQIEHNKHLALHDHLTGLPNRRLYQDRLASAGAGEAFEAQAALLVVDLDRFKQVNDTLGHHVGDLVLQRVATMFS